MKFDFYKYTLHIDVDLKSKVSVFSWGNFKYDDVAEEKGWYSG